MLLTAAGPRWELFREGAIVYQEIVENAIVVTGARFVNLSWYDPAENRITGVAWSIRPRGIMDDAMRAAQAVVAGFNPLQVRFSGDVNPAVHEVLVEGRALLAPFTEHAAGTVHPALVRISQTILGLRWTHSVPLRIGGTVVGSLAYHFPGRPSAGTLRVAEAFAEQAALTVENARLSDALRTRTRDLEGSRERIAVAEERVRREIAEVLHGRVETRILVATQRLLECGRAARGDPRRAAAMAGEVADELDRIREDDVRRASHRLHPSMIGIGLVPALELLADGIVPPVDVRLDTSARVAGLDRIVNNALPERVRIGVYRFVEEALSNCARHSGASSAIVRVDVDDTDSLRVTVSDGGRGFDGATTAEGVGMRAMRDHIERLGGVVRVTSGRGEGTVVDAAVPIGEASQREERRRWSRRSGGSADDPDRVLQRIAEDALLVTGARFISLSLYEASEQVHALGAVAPRPLFLRLLAAARSVVPGFDPAGIRFPADVNPATKTVLVDGRPLLATLEEHAAGTIHPLVLRAALVALRVQWVHSVPLRVGGAVVGALAFHFSAQPPAERLPVAEAFAKQAALTLENVRLSDVLHERADELRASRERIAAAEERTRREIAELLHGHVQTRLLVTTHRLRECLSLFATDPEAAEVAVAALALDLDRMREEDVRQASRQLHPSAIVVGLVAALQELAEGLGPRLDVRVEASDAVTALDDARHNLVREPVRLGVYRVVEEALANVARHTATAGATVRLDVDGSGCLRTSVADGGHGFDLAAVRAGVGLRAMRDRVERLGGTLIIESSPAGTTLTATLPLGSGGQRG